MKNLKFKIILIIALFYLLTSINFAQGSFGIGGFIGGGFISANSPNQSSYTSSFFVEFKTPLSENIIPRISFLYMQDFNRLLPGSTNKYFPFLKGISLKGIASQLISENYFIEEGAGFVALNDHTFNDIDVWNYGVNGSITLGFNFRDKSNKGFRLGIGTEFGFSFANTFAKYYSLHLQTEYVF